MGLHFQTYARTIPRLFLVQFLILPSIASGDIGCPDKCTCKWKSGKETVECVESSLSSVPLGIAPGTQVLDLRHNEIRMIENGIFSRLGITNLQRIFCSNCQLMAVEPQAFLHLTNLVELDLSNNLLRTIPSPSLELTKALMRLTLAGNPIKVLNAKAFEHLKFVTNLDLSHCDIETIESKAFQGMESLLELRLESNRLNYIRGVNLFPLSLHLIELHGNPFHCDCRLLDFAHWIQQSGTPRTIEPLCHRPPRLANRTLVSLSLDTELACLPQAEAEIVDMDEGRARGSGWSTATKSSVGVTKAVEPGRRNVALRCSVFAVPSATVTWWRENRLVANNSVFEHLWEEQFYHIVEHRANAHQLISEFLILEVRLEDHGSFFCSAQNPAGVASINFTVQVNGASLRPTQGQEGGKESKAALEKTTNVKESETNKPQATEETMIKVEYILGFGAAVVIVLTIIIILILYLILQCRSRQKRLRTARAIGLHCDSNSGSFMERSTLDFIVPGEMELTKAVRSVSNSAMKTTTENKPILEPRNGNLGDNNAPSMSQVTLDDNHAIIPKATMSYNSLGYNQLPPGAPHNVYPYPRAVDPNSLMQCGQPVNWRQPYTEMVNGMVSGMPQHSHWPLFRPMIPPSYRNPPPPTDAKLAAGVKHGIIIDSAMGLPLCPCCGESNWHHFQYHPALNQGYGGYYANSGSVDGQPPTSSSAMCKVIGPFNPNDTKGLACPRSSSALYFHPSSPFPDVLSGTGWRDQPMARPPLNAQHQGLFPGFQHIPITYTGRGGHSASPMDDLRSGALSDGEADKATKHSNRRQHQLGRRSSTLSMSMEPKWKLGHNNTSVAPHYVTMSRASQQHLNLLGQKASGAREASDRLVGQYKLEKDSIRYSSQPFLSNGRLGSNILDFASSPTSPPKPLATGVNLVVNRQAMSAQGNPSNSLRKASLSGPPPIASKSQLDRLNYKSTAIMPKFGEINSLPQPRYQKPVSEQASHIANDDYLFPDLPPPPDALLDEDSSRTPETKFGNMPNSKCSSFDDLQHWVSTATDITAAANKAKQGFNTLPSNMASNYHPAYPNYPIHLPPGRKITPGQVTSALKGGARKRSRPEPPLNSRDSYHALRRGSGAVKVDLTFADKTIRRPDSVPDLAQEPATGLTLSPLPMKSQPSPQRRRPGGLKQPSTLGANSSTEKTQTAQRIGSSPGKGKHVMFTGVSDGDSPSEGQAEDAISSGDAGGEDVWVLRQDNPDDIRRRQQKKEFELIPVSGVVFAQPQPCPAPAPLSYSALQAPSLDGRIHLVDNNPLPLPPKGQILLAGASGGIEKTSKPAKPIPPPRTTPQLQTRATNPALERARTNQPLGGHLSVNESPDEGYHEDGDPGSEVI